MIRYYNGQKASPWSDLAVLDSTLKKDPASGISTSFLHSTYSLSLGSDTSVHRTKRWISHSIRIASSPPTLSRVR